MQIPTNTDNTMEGTDQLNQPLEALVRDGLDRFSGQITPVDFNLSDENSDRTFGPVDKGLMAPLNR